MLDTLVFSGGGIKGIGFIGCLNSLENNNLYDYNKINTFIGTSAGAIIASFLAVGYSIPELNEIGLKINFGLTRDIQELSLKVKDLVISTHDMLQNYIVNTIDENNISEELMLEYYKRYSIFAGDEPDDKSEYDRWGGACEQYAISEILKTPIYIYVAKKFNEKQNRIENGKIRNNKAEKNVRLQLYQTFGEKYKNNNNGLHILYKNTKNCKGHYMCLYKK